MPGMAVWEPESDNWIRWARTPGFDAYWYFRDAVFDAILPAPRGLALEVGCGEGRVTRDLVARGYDVLALDPAETLVRAAADVDPVGRYAIADGFELPFVDGRFDLVMSYNVLQNVADLPGAVQEIDRVLSPGGALCVCVVHPVTDLGRFEDDAPGARFVLRERYYDALPHRGDRGARRDHDDLPRMDLSAGGVHARVRVGRSAHRGDP